MKVPRGGQQLSGLARVLETVARLAPFGLIAHHLRQPQGREDVAHPRDAPAHRCGDLAGAHLPFFRQDLDHREAQRIP